MDGQRAVVLPEVLCSAAEQKYGHRFGGIEDLLTATLRELVREDALKMDEKEQQIIEDRLKGLGYI